MPPRKKPETLIRNKCNKWLKDNGWIQFTIYTGGIPIFGGGYATNPAKGIPDCIAFNRRLRRMVWIEYKDPLKGSVSIDQKDWHYLLKLTGQEIYVITSLPQLIETLNPTE